MAFGPISGPKKRGFGPFRAPKNVDSVVLGPMGPYSGPLRPMRVYPDPTKAPMGPNGPHMGPLGPKLPIYPINPIIN